MIRQYSAWCTKIRVEIAILRRLFEPEEAGLAVYLTGEMETVEAIATRAELDLKVAKSMHKAMYKKGFIEAVFDKYEVKPTWKFALMPVIVGFYEEQWETIDHELAHLFEHYWAEGGLTGIMKYSPALHRAEEMGLVHNVAPTCHEQISEMLEVL